MTGKQKKGIGSEKIAIGAGLVLAAAAAAYFLSGERGKKNKKAIKEWVVRAHEDIARELQELEHVSKKEYHEIVERVVSIYKDLQKEEMAELVALLKSHWQEFSKK